MVVSFFIQTLSLESSFVPEICFWEPVGFLSNVTVKTIYCGFYQSGIYQQNSLRKRKKLVFLSLIALPLDKLIAAIKENVKIN